jgi:hypothetical protein
LGLRHLSWAASDVNSFITKLDNPSTNQLDKEKALASNKAELEKTVDQFGKYNFHSMSPEESKKVWDAFEKRFYDLTQNTGKMLNNDEASGRDTYLSARLGSAEGYAQAIIQGKTNIITVKASLAALQARIAANPDHKPTKQQQDDLDEINGALSFQKKVLATLLADWLLNRFFHPEVYNAEQLKNDGAQEYKSMDQYLDLMDFASGMKEEIGQVFAVMDSHLVPLKNAIPDTKKK